MLPDPCPSARGGAALLVALLLVTPFVLDACATPPPSSAAPSAPAPVANACSAPPSTPPASAPATRPLGPIAAPLDPPNVAPAAALAAFDRQCGACHRSDRDTAKPEALAIFDMTRAGWLSRLSPERLKVAIHRFEKKSEEERKDAMAFLNEELTRRTP